MITALLLQLGAIGPQALPATGCAAYLWSVAEPRRLVAMATAEPGVLRVQVDGRTLDLPRTGAEGIAARGLAAASRYAAADTEAELRMVATERPDLRDGAAVPEGSLTVARAGQDAVVIPVAGMIGCRPAAR